MALSVFHGKDSKRSFRGYNLVAAALIAAGVSMFADGVFKAWSEHGILVSSIDMPIWLPHMPRKSELIKVRAAVNLETRFKPYQPVNPVKPAFLPAVGIKEVVSSRQAEEHQTHVASTTDMLEIKAVSRAMDTGVWDIEGFPEALLKMQRYTTR